MDCSPVDPGSLRDALILLTLVVVHALALELAEELTSPPSRRNEEAFAPSGLARRIAEHNVRSGGAAREEQRKQPDRR
jgi:hypothetical protein